jgi:O-antigen ligase
MDMESVPVQRRAAARRTRLFGAYLTLLLFMLIYFARPEDWIAGLSRVPLAKITGILSLLALIFSLRDIRWRLSREIIYLALLTAQLFLASALSPIWRGGALQVTLDFAKVLIVIVVISVTVNSTKRLRLLIVTQAASVAVIAAVAIWKGHLAYGRLAGILGGNYSNPNDLALAIVLSSPLCLVLIFLAKTRLGKAGWALALPLMVYAVIRTGSRGGFLSLSVVTAVCLWEFAIRGRRRYLLVVAGLLGIIIWQTSSRMLVERINGTFDQKSNTASAYDSSQERQQLFWRSIEVTKEHPLFGIGPGNFQVVSGWWQPSHNSYTQMTSEGGLPAFILYALILALGFTSARATKRLPRGPKESKLLARALQASLTGFIVGSVFSSMAYEFFPYVLVAYTTALLRIARKSVAYSKGSKTVSQEVPVSIDAPATVPELSSY